jgi:hypothetical protein
MASASSGLPVVVVAPMCDIVQQLAVHFPRITVVGKGRAWPGTQRYHEAVVTTGQSVPPSTRHTRARGAATSIA